MSLGQLRKLRKLKKDWRAADAKAKKAASTCAHWRKITNKAEAKRKALSRRAQVAETDYLAAAIALNRWA